MSADEYLPIALIKVRIYQNMKRYEDLSDLADGNRTFANQIMQNVKSTEVAQAHIIQARLYERLANWYRRVAKLYAYALEDRTHHIPEKVAFT